MNGNSVFGKRGTNSRKRTLYYDIDVEAGQYIAFVKIHYDKGLEKDFDVNLAIYAEFPCEIALASKGEAVAFSGNPNVDWNGQEVKSSGAWNELVGYGQLQQGIEGNNGGWSQPSNNGGWGQQPSNDNGWGQPSNNGGWDQGNSNNGGWGQQPSNNNDGWGQPSNNGGGYGYGNNNGW